MLQTTSPFVPVEIEYQQARVRKAFPRTARSADRHTSSPAARAVARLRAVAARQS